MTFILTYSATHKDIPVPMTKETKVTSKSLSKLLSEISLSGKQACDLKNYGKTSWTDHKEVTHTIEVREDDYDYRIPQGDLGTA